MTKKSPAMSPEIQRLTDEVASLRAQLAAKPSHDQCCPHCKQKITAPATDASKRHDSTNPPEDFVPILPPLPRGEPDKYNVPPKRPQVKEWTNEDFRKAIRHWNFDHMIKNTPEAIDEAEAALYEVERGSWASSRERERHVRDTMYFGLMETLRGWGYYRHDIPHGFGVDRKMKIYRAGKAPELPDWLKLDFFEIRDDPDLVGGTAEEWQAWTKKCALKEGE
jgi:hypothetical protein